MNLMATRRFERLVVRQKDDAHRPTSEKTDDPATALHHTTGRGGRSQIPPRVRSTAAVKRSTHLQQSLVACADLPAPSAMTVRPWTTTAPGQDA